MRLLKSIEFDYSNGIPLVMNLDEVRTTYYQRKCY